MVVCGFVATGAGQKTGSQGAGARIARRQEFQSVSYGQRFLKREGRNNIRVAIHGFGRIGRSILRGWLAQTEKTFDIVAITLGSKDIRTAIHLLKYDSVLGRLQGDMFCTDNEVVFNGQVLQFVHSPNALEKLGVDVIIDATGKNNSLVKASKLIEQTGASNIVLTTPCKDCPVYVHNVNSSKFNVQQDKVVCLYGVSIAAAIKVIDDHFDVQYGMTNVINPFTSDMSLHDKYHKDLRRTRAAACNIIPTTTGSADAVGAIIPKLQGQIRGSGFRVPVHSVAIHDLVLKVRKPCTRDEVNDALRAAAAGPMQGTLRVEEQPLVSSDFRKSNYVQTVDATLTMVMGGDLIKVMSWYDNEWSYGQHALSFVSVIAAKLEESRCPVCSPILAEHQDPIFEKERVASKESVASSM